MIDDVFTRDRKLLVASALAAYLEADRQLMLAKGDARIDRAYWETVKRSAYSIIFFGA